MHHGHMRERSSDSAQLEELLSSSWPGLKVSDRMSGGARTEVWSGFLRDRAIVLRYSSRSDDSRTWEWNLLKRLNLAGIRVPRLVPTTDGVLDVSGWHVYPYVEGREPDADDPRLLGTLRAVHAETVGWPQRPGSVSASTLLTSNSGGDVDLTRMPTDLVEALRDAWRSAMDTHPSSVVHGDCGPRNALIEAKGQCVLIDWDEARVDAPIFDLPTNDLERRAGLAWEIATCWCTEPSYARSLVGQLMR